MILQDACKTAKGSRKLFFGKTMCVPPYKNFFKFVLVLIFFFPPLQLLVSFLDFFSVVHYFGRFYWSLYSKKKKQNKQQSMRALFL